MPHSICPTFRERDPPKMIAWLGGPDGQQLDIHGGGQLACRIAEALAEQRGTEPVTSPVTPVASLSPQCLNHRK
jgi:hypothetical protein